MNRLLLLLLVLPIAGFSQQSDSALVGELNRQWIASYATKDTATMQKILADDFVMISATGKKLSRMDVINNVGSPELSNQAYIDSTSIRVFGQIALVVGFIHFTIESKGEKMQGKNCYSDMYIKRRGKWQAVSAHVTLLDMK